MPEIRRFYGIIVRMFMEPSAQHHLPHFRAYYQDFTAVVSIDNAQLIAGEPPQKQLRLVLAWAELRREN